VAASLYLRGITIIVSPQGRTVPRLLILTQASLTAHPEATVFAATFSSYDRKRETPALFCTQPCKRMIFFDGRQGEEVCVLLVAIALAASMTFVLPQRGRLRDRKLRCDCHSRVVTMIQ